MVKIGIPRINKNIITDSQDNLLAILLDNHVFIERPCGGRGSCGKCKIKHISGDLSPLGEDEKKLLTEQEQQEGIRLACCLYPQSDLLIDVIAQEQNHKVLKDGYVPKFQQNPAIRKRVIEIPKPTIEDQTPYEDLFKRELGIDHIDFEIMRSLKMESGTFTAVYHINQLIGIEKGNTSLSCYGVAVDIGTTTVVASVIDLNTGAEIDSEADLNAQKNFGQDVLTRISYVQENEDRGIRDLQKAIVDLLNGMIKTICSRRGIDHNHIYEMSVAANCTMMHMLLGVEPLAIAAAPYAPIFVEGKNISAQSIGLVNVSRFARLNCLPAVSAYIGADIVAGAYVANLQNAKNRILFIDIGTNGEIVLSDKGRLVACSCAAGPALEGMNISSGMRAADGAIEEIKITESGIKLEVIGGGNPIGICGSGILAAIRELVKNKFITPNGMIIKRNSIDDSDFRYQYIEVNGKKRSVCITGGVKKITITQGDVRQVQLAKSAILSGIIALVNKIDIHMSDLDEVIIAGQFGAHLPAKSLVGTGIIPSELKEKITYIGNSSKAGAYISLLSVEARNAMEKLAKKIEYTELSVVDGYERLFIECSRFNV
ncbi:MAG: ASKHA domain-containing protein [Veillonellales bacterium]